MQTKLTVVYVVDHAKNNYQPVIKGLVAALRKGCTLRIEHRTITTEPPFRELPLMEMRQEFWDRDNRVIVMPMIDMNLLAAEQELLIHFHHANPMVTRLTPIYLGPALVEHTNWRGLILQQALPYGDTKPYGGMQKNHRTPFKKALVRRILELAAQDEWE